MYKKFLPLIIIALILVNLFAPFSVGINSSGVAVINKNTAEAAESAITFTAVSSVNSIAVTFVVDRRLTDNHDLQWVLSDIPGTTIQKDPFKAVSDSPFIIPTGANVKKGSVDISDNVTPGSTVKKITCLDPADETDGCIEKTVLVTISGLSQNKKYYFNYWGYNGNQAAGLHYNDTPQEIDTTNGGTATTTFTSQNLQAAAADAQQKAKAACDAAAAANPNDADLQQKCKDAQQAASVANTAINAANGGSDPLPVCLYWFGAHVSGCIADALYGLFFVPTSALFSLAGKFFDFTFLYSVTDKSYKDAFVSQGWAMVRDFVNIFFIFVLLYIAFATILEIHGFSTKKMIINVVMIGLLMNFSLFVTQVMIDASNILARVFYTPSIIVVGQNKDSSGNVISKPGPNNEIQLSAGLVDKVDPERIIQNSNNAGKISQANSTSAPDDVDSNTHITNTTFILITLLSSAINVIGFIVFLSVGLIFVTRVIGLWLAMIFAPFAFFSYTVPSMQGLDMVGWKKWWPDTLKLCFVAPIFIFFLYLILKFVSAIDILKADGKTGIDFLVAVIVPFAFIMILLMKAKDIAKSMSGKLGEMATKVGSAASGMALGAVSGGYASLLRGTVGRAGNALANSSWAKRYEARGGFGGQTLRNMGKAAGKSSFDARATGAGKMAGKSLGVGSDLGKPKDGGFAKMRADKTKKRQERAQDLKVGEDEKVKQDLNAVEADLQNLLKTNSHTLEQLDKRINAARQNAADTASKAKLSGATTADKAAAKDAADLLTNLKDEKKALKSGNAAFTRSAGRVAAGESATATFTNNRTVSGKSINDLEDHDIPDAHHAVEEENRDRGTNYSKHIKSRTNKVANFIWSGGQHSNAGANEAAHKIQMDVKLDSGGKGH